MNNSQSPYTSRFRMAYDLKLVADIHRIFGPVNEIVHGWTRLGKIDFSHESTFQGGQT
jgi:hypothetical protein